MNICALIGNLAADPTIRYTTGGKAICTFRLAVSRPGGEEADFFTIVAYERQAEVCKEYLTTGRRVAVEGRLKHVPSTDYSTGRTEVIANRVELLGAPRTAKAEA